MPLGGLPLEVLQASPPGKRILSSLGIPWEPSGKGINKVLTFLKLFFLHNNKFFFYILCLCLKGDFTHETHFFLHIVLFWISSLERCLILNVILMALNLVVLKATKNKRKDLKAPAAISLSRNLEGSFM